MRDNDKTNTYFDLIELIDKQSNVIKKQSKTITKLLNENAEQENMINELMRSQ
ncbi:hypothetical protein SPD48_09460 [Pseudogracilibacillus sp. SE30717A]|uniref:hypothetical protein n=1 Tax=Pseudogracilibacillus sp. SE30717A TaxID=3098293 RepID=UPI00300E0DA3